MDGAGTPTGSGLAVRLPPPGRAQPGPVPSPASPFDALRFHSIASSLHAVPGVQAFGIPESDAAEIDLDRLDPKNIKVGLSPSRSELWMGEASGEDEILLK